MRVVRFALTVAVSLAAASCTSVPTVTPTQTPNAVASLTSTIAPTLTPTPAPTNTPLPTETTAPTSTPTKPPTATATAAPCTAALRVCAAKRSLEMGVKFTWAWFGDAKWREIVGREFDLAVIAAGVPWADIEPALGRYDFAALDEQVAFARSQNMVVQGHALMDPGSAGYLPDWLANGNFSRDEMAQILKGHLAEVMGRYKGKIGHWIVVEEPYSPGVRETDSFYAKFGYDYIDLAHQTAREVDPSAVLLYNDTQNYAASSPNTNLTRKIVERLKSNGLIDGVGLEMQLEGDQPPNEQDVAATMKSYGVPVYVTGIVVDLKNVPGSADERYAKQASIFGDMLSACLSSGVCRSFAVWDIGDKYSWLEHDASNADPTSFDDRLDPKPAYFALANALR